MVYCEGVRKGSSEQFDFLLNIFLTTNVATEQQLTLFGMSCAPKEETVNVRTYRILQHLLHTLF